MTIDYQQPDEAFLRDIDIHELLPQQEPFVMVSRLVHFDGVRTICEMDIQADNIFVEDGHLNASGMIENIAQTCAARIGYVNKYILKKALPEVGQQITTIVDVIEEVFGMTLASAVIKQGNRTLMTTEMKIAVKEQ